MQQERNCSTEGQLVLWQWPCSLALLSWTHFLFCPYVWLVMKYTHTHTHPLKFKEKCERNVKEKKRKKCQIHELVTQCLWQLHIFLCRWPPVDLPGPLVQQHLQHGKDGELLTSLSCCFAWSQCWQTHSSHWCFLCPEDSGQPCAYLRQTHRVSIFLFTFWHFMAGDCIIFIRKISLYFFSPCDRVLLSSSSLLWI